MMKREKDKTEESYSVKIIDETLYQEIPVASLQSQRCFP